MKIYDLDYDQRIEKIKRDIDFVKQLNNSVSESRSKYKEFADEIGISFDALDTCVKSFEKTVLIDAYTLSEQLIKNTYYYLLYDNENSSYVNTFINKKIPKEKFSPNVKYEEMQKGIRNDLIPEFSFSIGKDNDCIKSYDILVGERHTYAHTGFYQYDFEKIDDVVKAIEYFYNEFELVLTEGNDYRVKFQEKIFKVSSSASKANVILNNYSVESKDSVSALKKAFFDLQNEILDLYHLYENEMSFAIFSDLSNKLLDFSNAKICDDIDNAIALFTVLLEGMQQLKLAKA